MEAGHNGVVCGLAVAKHAGGEPGLVLGLVPILHRQITDEIVSDLVNGHGIVILPAQVKIILHNFFSFIQYYKLVFDCYTPCSIVPCSIVIVPAQVKIILHFIAKQDMDEPGILSRRGYCKTVTI